MNRGVNENFQAMFIKIKNWEDGSVSVAPMVSRGQQHVSITLVSYSKMGGGTEDPPDAPVERAIISKGTLSRTRRKSGTNT